MQVISWHFGQLGAIIGYRPLISLFCSLLILIPGFYGLLFHRSIHLGIDEGFTRLDAPSRREVNYQKAFFGASDSAVPWYLATFAVPTFENGSMTEDDEFEEFSEFYTNITQGLTMSGSNNSQITYQDICAPFCDINGMLTKAMTAPYFLVNRAYPNFEVFGYDVSIGKFIFMRNMSKDGTLLGSKLMAMYFTVFVENEETKIQLEELDRKVIELAKAHNENPERKINVILHGNYPVQLEVQRGFKETMPLIFGGILASLVIFGLMIFISAKLFRQSMILSLPAALGSTCLLGMSINVTVPMTPFVGISIVLNAVFIFQITDLWHRITRKLIKKTDVLMVEAAEFGKNRNPVSNGNNKNLLSNGNSVIYRATKSERMQFLFFAFTVFYMSILQIFFFCPIMILTAKKTPDHIPEPLGSQNEKSKKFVFIVKNPPKFDDPQEFIPFKKMLHELETLPMVLGPNSNMMWLFDYFKNKLEVNYHKADFDFVNMSSFNDFISKYPYDAWNDGVKWEIDPETNEVKIKEMLFMITFQGIKSLQGKVEALTACRAILDRYSQFDIASFDTDSATVDTILSVPPSLIFVVLTLVTLTAIFSCLVMRNMVGTALTTIFTATNIIYLFGFSHFLGIQLDPLGVATFVFSILVGNYLVIQCVSIFLRNRTEPNRLQITLEHIFSQVVKVVLLVVVIGIPVLCAPVFIHRSNIQIFLLSVTVSIFHVIFIIPSALDLFPTKLTGESCCYDSE
ncbi:hypothetical protein FO519_003333 [Halicephalobus sp. NKZ332]|nr:hypothetical protein FO519_003333 [Halicephalobus sp. NKZ332]